jgi:hypothetical protein
MNEDKERCDHCGKWVTIKYSALYRLEPSQTNSHPNTVDVAVCWKCCCGNDPKKCKSKYPPEYWYAWLEKRFASIDRAV